MIGWTGQLFTVTTSASGNSGWLDVGDLIGMGYAGEGLAEYLVTNEPAQMPFSFSRPWRWHEAVLFRHRGSFV